jgi:hypothetical protein
VLNVFTVSWLPNLVTPAAAAVGEDFVEDRLHHSDTEDDLEALDDTDLHQPDSPVPTLPPLAPMLTCRRPAPSSSSARSTSESGRMTTAIVRLDAEHIVRLGTRCREWLNAGVAETPNLPSRAQLVALVAHLDFESSRNRALLNDSALARNKSENDAKHATTAAAASAAAATNDWSTQDRDDAAVFSSPATPAATNDWSTQDRDEAAVFSSPTTPCPTPAPAPTHANGVAGDGSGLEPSLHVNGVVGNSSGLDGYETVRRQRK